MSKKNLFVYFFILALSTTALAQHSVTGTVRDLKGEPLSGVSINVKNSSIGTTSDKNGSYSISVLDQNSALIFSMIGFTTQEINLNGRASVDLTLAGKTSNLNEVIITGYKTQDRTTLTTSISKLDIKVLENIPFQNLATGMQGTMAGVVVQTTSGQPGAAPRVIIRGGTSINNPNGSSPLYIVDGVIRDLNDLSPDDVESIQVLKDAAATSLYGARGSNGVVLVKTKSGKPGKTQVTYKYDFVNSETMHTYEFPSARDYIETTRRGFMASAVFVPIRLTNLGPTVTASAGVGNDLTKNTLWTPQYLTPQNQYKLNEGWESMTDPFDPTKTIIFKDTDFQPLLYQKGKSHNHYISVSGGNDRATFNMGAGYMYAQGVIKTSDYNRTTFNLNGDLKANDKLSFTGRVGYQRSGDNHIAPVGNNALQRYTALPHTAKYRFEDGTIAPGFNTSLGNPDYYLPIWDNKGDELTNDRLTLSIGSHFEILPGLSFDPLASLYINTSNTNTFLPQYYNGTALITTRVMSAGYNSFRQKQVDAIFNYKMQFHREHSISALAGFAYVGSKTYNLSASGQGAATDNIQTLNAATTRNSISSAVSERLILSYLYNIDYNFRQKYLLTINGRYDGASNLGEKHQWGFFPGISGGWNIYKEDFWKALAIHDKLRLKLRASYGVNGNLGLLGDYTAQGSYASGAVYGGASAIQNTVLPNADLRWEQSKTLDFGADIGIFNSRVNILFDVFRRVTDNLVTTLNLPPSTGFGSILTNYGSLEGKGIELELNGRFFPASSAFQWETAITFTKTKNKILKLPFNGVEKNRVGGELLWDASTKSYVWKGGLQEGGTIGELFAYKALGVYATDADAAAGPQDLAYVNGVANNFKRSGGDVIWQDTDGNGTIDARDRVYIGNIYPTMFGGIHNYFTYKNISLTVRMDYTLGHSIEDQLSKTFDQNGAGDISMTINMVKNGWKKQGDVTTVPQYMWLDPKQNIGRGSSAYFLKGDFLALREITLSYTVPASVMKKVGMNSLRLNLTGNNLHYFSKAGLLGGVVPEDGGVDNGRYPLSRNFIFGASLSF
ncbi:SusC/RagA family TonB-linked outer membrane protein [Flavisolibacter ginsenosidimutans]|uniref:SusC/RagA family TonB-linked outer membrane protein n=2 Tax=Flavisolibacter ginsenosidimutans TaxID=661481 RepID=A0A5B8UPI9_9BACT|nr:SusC/RagA family TonB-linked outer membrane protein [Flavisolibacter ginsenosidimutans]